MLGNDKLQDCVIAGMLHAIQQWKTIVGKMGWWHPDDATAVRLYSQITGYVPGNVKTDKGTNEINALVAWTRGLNVGDGVTDTLAGFASVDTRSRYEMKLAITWFANAMLGIALPLSVEDGDPREWVMRGRGHRSEPGTWGHHLVLGVGYDRDWVYAVSWGDLVRFSWEFWRAYCINAYALISPDFLRLPTRYSGVNWKQVLVDWQRNAARGGSYGG